MDKEQRTVIYIVLLVCFIHNTCAAPAPLPKPKKHKFEPGIYTLEHSPHGTPNKFIFYKDGTCMWWDNYGTWHGTWILEDGWIKLTFQLQGEFLPRRYSFLPVNFKSGMI